MPRIDGIIYKLQQYKKHLCTTCWSYLEKVFVANIPSEEIRDLPGYYVLILGSLVYSSILSIFLYTLLSSYISSRQEKFLSLTTTAGDCSEVYRPLSGAYLVDTSGNWQGMSQFQYSSAIYSFEIYNFEGSQDDFYAMMYLGYEEILELAEIAKSQNLALNLLSWMAYSLEHDVGDFSQTWVLTGSPSVVFNRAQMVSSLSSVDGGCSVTPLTSFDISSATLSIKYNYIHYNATPSCRDALNPQHFGYNPNIDDDVFALTLDLKSLATAVAVNHGVISPYYLEKVPYSSYSYTYNSSVYDISLYYNSYLQGMTPITCIIHEDYGVCALQLNDMYVYPLFNHMGYSTSQPVYCDCASSVGTTKECNYFNLLAGFLVFDYDDENESSVDSLNRLLEFSLTANGDRNGERGMQLNRAAYNASYDAVISHEYRNNSDWRESSYEFCHLSDGSYCTVVSTLLSDSKYAVSEHHYQVRYGSCNDSISLHPDAIERLATTTPEPLVMPYYECRQSQGDALLEASGIATGNVSLIIPVITTFFLVAYSIYLKLRQYPAPQTYSSEEKRELLEFLAVNILSIRDSSNSDGPNSSHAFSIDRQPVLHSIKEELASEPEHLAKHFYSEELKNYKQPPPILPTCNVVENPLYTKRRAVSRLNPTGDVELLKLSRAE